MRLDQVDLNLFVVFDTIYREHNLTRASEVLHITQPAVSNALRRLRETFNDPLFVRTSQGMTPTPFSQTIIGSVREALDSLDDCIKQNDTFDPALAQKTFHVAGSDSSIAHIFPSLLSTLQTTAPDIQLQFYQINREHAQRDLAGGTLDFALDGGMLMNAALHHELISRAPYVCAVRPDHPLIDSDTLTLEQYLALDHIHVSGRPRGMGHVDLALQALGEERHITLRTQHHTSAPLIAAQSDLALSIPPSQTNLSGLKIFELPFEVPPLDLYLYWHKSADHDQANRWMREVMLTSSQKELPHQDLPAAANQ